jgi:hypothetical protein
MVGIDRRAGRPDNRRAMTVEGFGGFREVVRRAVRHLNGAPNVLESIENHVRGHHELLLAAWDELKQRGAAVTHVTKAEYDPAFELVNDVLRQGKGKDVAALERDQNAIAKALIDLVAQEVKAYHKQPRR